MSDKPSLSRSKASASVAVFAAAAIALQIIPLRVPAPYAPFLIYQLWEIPVVIAFLMFGPLVGFSVALINFLGLLVIFPGALPTGPLYNLLAVVSMLAGIFIVHRGQAVPVVRRIALATLLAILLRVVVMSFVNYLLLPFPPPLGFGFTRDAVLGLLPLLALFNATVVLYTVPLGELVARGVVSRMRMMSWAFPSTAQIRPPPMQDRR